MLRNMHHSTDTEDIKQELADLGHDVVNIQNVLQSRTKTPLPLFSIELKTKSNNKDIYSVTTLLHCIVKFEPPHKHKTIPQCTNCQKNFTLKTFAPSSQCALSAEARIEQLIAPIGGKTRSNVPYVETTTRQIIKVWKSTKP